MRTLHHREGHHGYDHINKNSRKQYIMTKLEQYDIQSQIIELQSTLTGDMMQDMEKHDEIHNLRMKLNGTKPTDSHIDCVGCGA